MVSWVFEEGVSTEDRRVEREGELGFRDIIEFMNLVGYIYVFFV